MPARHLTLGRDGEEAAAGLLRARGYEILERNWRYRQWELDFVCRKEDVLVFVEVKTRGAGALASPAEGLTPAKRSRLVTVANRYLAAKSLWGAACRFDLVTVTAGGEGLRAELVENAFTLDEVQAGRRGGGWQPW